MDNRSCCLLCGISRAEVDDVRSRDGYTLGCGIESNTENGFDYEELSPRHRWAPWRDAELAGMGIRPEAFERYRTTSSHSIHYAACADRVQGHVYSTHDDPYSPPAGTCWNCGARKSTEQEPDGPR